MGSPAPRREDLRVQYSLAAILAASMGPDDLRVLAQIGLAVLAHPSLTAQQRQELLSRYWTARRLADDLFGMLIHWSDIHPEMPRVGDPQIASAEAAEAEAASCLDILANGYPDRPDHP